MSLSLTEALRPARRWSFKSRIASLFGLLAVGLIALLFVPRIGQDPAYHLFADIRPCLGIPNFGDVISNLAFLYVGLAGLVVVLGPRRHAIFREPGDSAPYIVFFLGVTLVAFGSAYYHLDPNNETLLWDRLPMTIAFMALTAAIFADRVDRMAALVYLLPILVVLGLASLVYWELSALAGADDLRFYGFVQFFPIVLLPVILWLFPDWRYLSTRGLIWLVAWYGLAKVFEHFDGEFFDLLGRTVSGHTLKHLAAAVAPFVVLRMLLAAGRRSPAIGAAGAEAT